MKTKLFIIAIILVAVNLVSAQEKKTLKVGNWYLTDVIVSSGKTALTSGLDTKVSFSNGKDGIFFIQANNDRIITNIGKKLGKFSVIESFGVYKNIPWTGPMFVYANDVFDVMVWNGMGFAKTDELKAPGYKPQFFFSYEGVGLTFAKNNRIGAAVQWFATAPMNWFVSYKRTMNLGEKSKLFAEVTYNHSLDIPMFVIGYNLKLN